MSLEAWGDENPYDADYEGWVDSASDAGWIDPDDLSLATIDVIGERSRQQNEEGWSLEHDDTHDLGEMARAAACYAISNRLCPSFTPTMWPWDGTWWKPKSRREDLVRAAALLIAEIERIDRSQNNLSVEDGHDEAM